MTARRFVAVAGSAPEGWDKRKLLPPPARARKLRRIIARNARRAGGRRVPIAAGLFESGSRMAAVVRWRPFGWRYLMGHPNNRIRGLVRGNVLLTRGIRRRWVEPVAVDVGRRSLYFTVAVAPLLGVAFVVAHRETRSADPDGKGREAAHEALTGAVLDLMDDGWEVVLFADWNGGEPAHEIRALRTVHNAGVDWIRATRGVRAVTVETVDGPNVDDVTDHPHGLLLAVLEVDA